MPGSEHRVSQQYQPGSDRLVDGVATLGNRRHVAQHMRPAQLALGAVDEAVSRILVGHQHPIKLTAQQPLRCLLTAAKRRHEADRDLAQGQPHPASLTAPLVPGFIGMDDGGRLHLLFDGLVGRGEHGADPALRFTDGASAKAQTEVLLELLLYLADALVELTTLQSDIAQQISPHLAVAHRIGQGCFTGGDAPTAGAPIQLMLCHHIADLGQVKHLMNPVGLVMGHHLLTTAGALPGRIVWYCRQSVVLRMTFTPLPLVARLGTTSLAGSGALARRRGPRAISGGGLGGVIAVLVEAVFKLGDARHQLVNQLVGLLEGQRQAGWWRNGFAHDVMVPSWRDQARGNSGSRDDRLTFSCQCHLGEQLQSIDVDFLCPDKSSYRAVREQVTSNSLGNLVKQDFQYAREIMFDRYGVRTFIKEQDATIKLEIVSFDNYDLVADTRKLFPIPFIDQESCFYTKLLANSDRCMHGQCKDIFDILAMYDAWGGIPQSAITKAEKHYGSSVLSDLIRSLKDIQTNSAHYYELADAMLIQHDFAQKLIGDVAPQVLANLS